MKKILLIEDNWDNRFKIIGLLLFLIALLPLCADISNIQYEGT
jgi:hypothetical protein